MQVSKDKVVTFHYVIKDKDTGEVIEDSKEHGEPAKVLFGRNKKVTVRWIPSSYRKSRGNILRRV
jgi:hypothetical protein